MNSEMRLWACMCTTAFHYKYYFLKYNMPQMTQIQTLSELSSVISVSVIYFPASDGVVAMATTFQGKWLAGTLGTQGREAL